MRRHMDGSVAAAYSHARAGKKQGSRGMKSVLLAVTAVALAGTAAAHDYKAGFLEIKHPWARATPKGATVAGGYLTVTNKGASPDRLVGGSSPAAGRFEIHEMKMEGGVMKMRQLAQGLEIKPGETVELKPGSYHLMFMQIKQPFETGKTVKGTLIFEKAGTIEVEYNVEAIGASPVGGHGGEMKHGH
jgi:copper(I)-binding protein